MAFVVGTTSTLPTTAVVTDSVSTTNTTAAATTSDAKSTSLVVEETQMHVHTHSNNNNNVMMSSNSNNKKSMQLGVDEDGQQKQQQQQNKSSCSTSQIKKGKKRSRHMLSQASTVPSKSKLSLDSSLQSFGRRKIPRKSFVYVVLKLKSHQRVLLSLGVDINEKSYSVSSNDSKTTTILPPSPSVMKSRENWVLEAREWCEMFLTTKRFIHVLKKQKRVQQSKTPLQNTETKSPLPSKQQRLRVLEYQITKPLHIVVITIKPSAYAAVASSLSAHSLRRWVFLYSKHSGVDAEDIDGVLFAHFPDVVYLQQAIGKLKLIDDDKQYGVRQQFLTDMFSKMKVS